jgi:hypothetical protein
MNLVQLDDRHNSHYKDIARINKEILNDLQSYNFDLNKSEISDAIINRMRAFFETHDILKRLFGKNQKQAASDYFVESCLIFMKAFFEKIGYDVKSEIKIWGEKKRSIRPDVTIWKNGNLIASIEMKVQLGRRRLEWRDEIRNREIDIKTKTNCKFFGVVCFTENNWQGFNRDEDWETKYFALTDGNWQSIENSFEKLLKNILNADRIN